MGNHMHLLIETREPNLGNGMHRLHGSYAQYFNRRHGHVGHLFQDRYDSVTILDDGQLWMAAAYIARNPVDAGLLRSAGPTGFGAATPTCVRGRAPCWLDTELACSRTSARTAATASRATQSFVDALIKRLPKGDSPLYGPEDSERRSGRRNQKAARRAAMAAGAA